MSWYKITQQPNNFGTIIEFEIEVLNNALDGRPEKGLNGIEDVFIMTTFYGGYRTSNYKKISPQKYEVIMTKNSTGF